MLGELGRYEEAVEYFDKALEKDPHDSGTWNNKGIAFRELGRYEEALECHNKAVELDPNNVNAWYNKGHTLSASALPGVIDDEYREIHPLDVNKHEKAIECFDKALELDPKHVNALSAKALEFHNHLHKPEEAIKCYDKWIEIEPKNLYPIASKADAYYDLQKYPEAHEYAKKAAVHTDPEDEFMVGYLEKLIKKIKEKLDS
jgi:tetratricopeptide (TPR) repeat protein